MTDAPDICRSILRLEAERVIARIAAPEAIEELDADLETLFDGLDRRGAGYPGHMLGQRYELTGADYALLQLALIPHHSLELLQPLGIRGPLTTTQAFRFLAPEAPTHLADEAMAQLAVVQSGLVELGEPMTVSPAVLELFGLS